MTTSPSCLPQRWRGHFLALLLLAAATVGPFPAFALDVPAHGGQWVVDLAGLLPAGDKDSLTTTLRAYAQKSGNRIVVLTIPGLQGEDLSAYANRVFSQWGVGQRDVDNGVLILVAAAERQVRFEVGRGIEDRLPDVLCRRIQQEVTVPHFKDGRFGPGLVLTVGAIEQALDAAPGAVPPGLRGESGDGPPLWFVLPLGAMLLLLGLEIFWRAYGSSHAARCASQPQSGSGPRVSSSSFLGFLFALLSRAFRKPRSRPGSSGNGSGGGGNGGNDGGGFSGGGGSSGGGGGGSSY